MLIDTHCHIDFTEFDQDRDEVFKRAKDNGVTRIINVGSSINGSEKSLGLSEKYPFLYSVVGIHPHEADSLSQGWENLIGRLARNEKAIGIGEIGLDFFKNFSRKENQEKIFLYQINLAKELGLPAVIHTRSAMDDTLRILKEAMPIKALLHCFSGDGAFLKESLDLGFFVSFACNITYKKAEDLRGLVKLAPLNRMMLETDAPYLSPEGFRGRRNEPMQVRLLAEFVADIKGVSIEQVADATTENAVSLFNLK